MFNISDKLMVSFDILLEIREFLKTGHPISNVIAAKLAILRKKAKTVSKVKWIWEVGHINWVYGKKLDTISAKTLWTKYQITTTLL